MKLLGGTEPEIDEDLAERMSAMRRPDESDMDYFERRYQERVSSTHMSYKSVKKKTKSCFV